MAGINFQAVRSLVSMAQVLELMEFIALECAGDQQRGACPVHGSTSPKSRSFSVNIAKNTFQCFKCGASGNQLDLWAASTKVSIFDAALDLCDKLNHDVPWVHRW